MKFLFDLFPVILFFVSFKWAEGHAAGAQQFVSTYFGGLISGGVIGLDQAPIVLATVVAVIATFVQIGYLLARKRKVDTMLWVSLAIITVFGGATIYFHSDVFIKWKPTVLYWCFAATFLVSLLVFKKNVLRTIMGEQIELPEPVWFRLALAWGAFFTLMGLLNLYVAFSFPTSTWVNFKLFGGMGLMFVFIIGQSLVLAKYMKDPE